MLVTLLLTACSSSFLDTASGQGSTTASGLPDLQRGLDETGCEDLSGNVTAGATVWFWGEYITADGGWTGEERMIYFANDAWVDAGGYDCELVWSMTATDTSPGTCTTCDIGLQVEASLDASQTSCPEGLQTDTETWSESYGIARAEDSTATWYFADSGTEFGAGYYNDTAINYLSEKSCSWFGG